jgi:hypothetical protein
VVSPRGGATANPYSLEILLTLTIHKEVKSLYSF